MHEHGLAKELWPQIRRLAEDRGLKKVERVDLVVGSLHGVAGDFLSHSLHHAFEGTIFDGCDVRVSVVEPGEPIAAEPGQPGGPAGGWELMITRIEGSR